MKQTKKNKKGPFNDFGEVFALFIFFTFIILIGSMAGYGYFSASIIESSNIEDVKNIVMSTILMTIVITLILSFGFPAVYSYMIKASKLRKKK